MMDRYSDAIGEIAIKLLKPGTDDYATQIWNLIEEDVVEDTVECAASDGDGFTNEDIALAIGRVLLNRLKVMTPNQYQELAMRTCSLIDQKNNYIPMLTNSMLGLCGESGECADLVKKYLYQNHDLDKEHMAKELGDVAWYLAEAAESIGYSLEDIFKMNIDKLRARYPEGHFETNRSLHRKDGDV